MASPYLQRPPRSLSEVRGELERRRRGAHAERRRDIVDAEAAGDAVEQGDRAGEF